MNKKNLLYIILSVVLFYFPNSYKPFSQDSDYILKPLEDVSSFSDYKNKIKEKKIFDFQPVRDFSHLIDFKMVNITGYKNFPLLVNVIILILTVILLRSLFEKYFNEKISYFLSLVYLLHPVTMNVYVAFSARKHILSLLLFLIFYKGFLSDRIVFLSKIKQFFLFSLALLSQPIPLLLPFWIIFQEKTQGLFRSIKVNLMLFSSSLVIGLINIYYYSIVFKEQTGFEKNGFSFDLGEKFLIAGRMFFQLFVPFRFSTQYDPASVLGLIGLVIMPFFAYLAYKNIPRKPCLVWCTLSAIVFFTLYHKGSNIFFLNTYLLYPLISVLFLLGYLLVRYEKKLSIFYFILLPLFIVSFHYGKIRTSQSDFYDLISQSEKSCAVVQAAVFSSLIESNENVFLKRSPEWLQMQCRVVNKMNFLYPMFVMTNMIYFDEKMSFEEKSNLLDAKVADGLDRALLDFALSYKHGNVERLPSIYKKIESYGATGSIFYNHPLIFQDYFKSCKKELICDELKDRFIRYKEIPYYLTFKN